MTPKTQPPQTNTTNQPNTTGSYQTIDCTGPDGKHFQATQADCGRFNASWGHPSSPSNPTSSNPANSGQKIDCTGPDGKHFQTTQAECDKFNAAWAHPPTSSGGSSSGSSSGTAPSGSSSMPPHEDIAAMCGRAPGYHWTGSSCVPN